MLGAGSLGSVIGGCLARGGDDVWLVSRRPEQVRAVSTEGLRIVEDAETWVVRPHITANAADVGPVDLVIVLVKAYDTQSAMASGRPLVGPGTTVLSLQNGIGSEEVIAAAVGRGSVMMGRTYVAGDAAAPGSVRAGIGGRLTVIGEPFGEVPGRAEAIATVLRRGGLDVQVSADIWSVVWRKLLVNVATGALAGITGLPYGLLYGIPEVHRTALAAVEEATAVAQACGAELGDVVAEEVWQQARRGLPESFRTSILQSLERGSPTEIGYINGAVVRLGAEAGVPTPVNATLLACVAGRERARAVAADASGSPGPDGAGGRR